VRVNLREFQLLKPHDEKFQLLKPYDEEFQLLKPLMSNSSCHSS
jgi:hypothetical protein